MSLNSRWYIQFASLAFLGVVVGGCGPDGSTTTSSTTSSSGGGGSGGMESACGDGVLATSETCDDGNVTAGDGCSATCTVESGFTCSGSPSVCTDADECAGGMANCDANASCTNTDGSFTCACNAGFTGDGVTCTDDDECAAGTANCDANASCTNTDGSFTCACNAGFTGDGVMCTDDDECALGTANCDANASCTNTDGSFTCACNMGFTGDGVMCADDDECALGTANCDMNASCTNAPGSFTCACNAGYTGNGVMCMDDDECALGTDNCDPNAACTNAPGSFTCACNAGFTGNGVMCMDDDECALGTDNCDPNATCTNTPGSFMCGCNTGYNGNGVMCAAVCGDGILVGSEICDSMNLGGNTCQTLGYLPGGTLACSAACQLDSSNCIRTQTIQNDNGACTQELGCSDVGGTGGNPNDLAECFTTTLAPPFDLTTVQYTMGSVLPPPTSLAVTVFAWNGPPNIPGAMQTTVALTAADLTAGPHTVTLPVPVTLNANTFCVSISGTDPADGYRIMTSTVDSVPNSSFILAPACGATTFTELSAINLPGDWCIRPTITKP